MRNVYQYLLSLGSQTFHLQSQKVISKLIHNSTNPKIIVGSCGQQILHGAFSICPPSVPITVISLGPVGRQLKHPNCKVITIKSSTDWISRTFNLDRPHHWVKCGHMDYWMNKEVIELCKKIIDDKGAAS